MRDTVIRSGSRRRVHSDRCGHAIAGTSYGVSGYAGVVVRLDFSGREDANNDLAHGHSRTCRYQVPADQTVARALEVER